MRSDLENNKARDLDIRSTRLGVQRTPLTGDLNLAEDSPLTNYFDPNGADRIITLPAKDRGLYFIIFNVGSANTLTVKDDLGNTLLTLTTIEGASFFCSGREWRYLSGVTGSSIAAELTSLDNTITLTANPTTVDLAVNEPQVDHNLLLNYVADQHVAHSGVTITAGVGLAGGGNIAANRTIDLDLSDLVADTPVLGDTFAFFDVSGGDTNKATLTTLNSILDHDALVGFVANEHIDHTTISITAGTGLTGGGTIAANRTISLDINGLSSDSPVGTDLLAFYDASGADHNKATISAIFAMMLPGADTQIVFNDAGVFGADPGFAYNKTTDTLEFSAGSRIGFDNLDVVIIHGANILSFNGAASGYVFTNGPIRGVVDTDTASTQVARFEGDRATPAANDEGYLSFYLSDSGGAQTEFARISWVATTVTDLSEVGALDFGLVSGGAFADRARLTATALHPSTNDSLSLGISGTAWSDAFFASGGVLNWNAGNYTITHSAGDLAFSGIITLPNSGLHILDTNASHDLIITPGSDLSADRILTLTTGDVARTLTISGNATISQDYSTTGNPQFATIELGAAADTTLARSSAGNMSIEGNVVYRAGGTDVPVTDGGTGSSTAAGAATNLGLGTGDSPQFLAVNIGHATDTTIARVGAGDVSVEGNVIYRAGGTDVPVTDGGTGASDASGARTNLGVAYGKQTIWIPAIAMVPRTTNGAALGTLETTTNKNMVKTLDFDSATQEFAQFDVRMPKSWDESTVTFIPVWSHPATATNFGVVWGLDAVAVSNDDALDVAFGTAQTSTDTGGTTNDSYQGPESSAITIAGTPAEGDLVQFRIHRDPANGSDTMAVDARLHGILLLFTNNNTNDT